MTAQIEQQLREYVDKSGPIDLPNGYSVRLNATTSRVHSLKDVLAVLGIQVPEKSERYDIDLNSLEIGATKLKSYAKAKMRAGLNDELDAVCKTKARVVLSVGKKKAEQTSEVD